MFAFPVESYRCMLKLREIEIFKGLRIDHSVEATFNAAGNQRDHAALGANMELSRVCIEGVSG